jgi:C4-dicarboxylate transporter DctQ subunit
MSLLSSVLVVLFSLIVFVFGVNLTVKGWDATTPALEMPRSIPYGAIPFGGLLMLIRSSQYLYRQVRCLQRGEALSYAKEKG